jgi:hypothetical protein
MHKQIPIDARKSETLRADDDGKATCTCSCKSSVAEDQRDMPATNRSTVSAAQENQIGS